MSIICNQCSHENPNDMEFCEVCGAELSLSQSSTDDNDVMYRTETEDNTASIPIVNESDIGQGPSIPTAIPLDIAPDGPTQITQIILVAKQINAPIPKFFLTDNILLVGRFDPDSGPVDVDLEGFVGDETVSRNHAEIYLDKSEWLLKDLGSTNGVFIKPVGYSRFGARITSPVTLAAGDEVSFGKVRFLVQF